ncbi:MAG: ankyrin repeat domain-containing protein [Bacteroidales bacterium]|nr:ankyrin repeat domain-containing protein [Bacteroidales bacterium]
MKKIYFSIIVLILLGSCIRTSSKNNKDEKIVNLSDILNSEISDTDYHPKDTIDFDKIKISEDSLDLALFNLITEYEKYSETKFIENIEILINKGANPDAVIEYQYSIRKAGTYIPIIKHFYRNRYRTYSDNSTPFLEAINTSKYNVVKKMIELKANVNAPSKNKIFPIDVALSVDNKKIINLLLESGCKVEYANLSGCKNIDVLEKMVELGADNETIDINFALENEQLLKRVLNLKPNVNNSEFDYKILFGNEKILDILLEAGLNNTSTGKFPDRDPLIFGAIKYGDVNTIKKLQNAGVNIMYREDRSTADYPFLEVIKSKNVDLIKFYIEQGANPNEKEWTKKSALMFAVYTDNDEIVKLLIDAGANLEYSGYFNKTALMQAIDYNKYISAQVLIDAGANVNFKNEYHESCLSMAIAEANFPMIKLLIDNGANPKIMFKKMNMAEYAKSVDAANMIIDYLEKLQ